MTLYIIGHRASNHRQSPGITRVFSGKIDCLKGPENKSVLSHFEGMSASDAYLHEFYKYSGLVIENRNSANRSLSSNFARSLI